MNFTYILSGSVCRKLALWATYTACQVPFKLTATAAAWTPTRSPFIQASPSGLS